MLLQSLITVKKKLLISFIVLIAGFQNASGFQTGNDAVIRWGELKDRLQRITPYQKLTFEELLVSRLVFGPPLYTYDANIDSIIPGVVSTGDEFGVSTNDYIFKITENVQFHDGNQLTSRDILFSIRTYKQFLANSSDIYFNSQIETIDSLSQISNYFFQLSTSVTPYDFKLMLADLPILSKSYYEGSTIQETVNNVLNKLPMGYGPFKLQSPVTNSGMVLKRYDNYYQGAAEFETINIRLYDDEGGLRADFIRENLDFTQIHEERSLREINDSAGGQNVIRVTPPYLQVNYLNYNMSDPILRVENMRKAINKSLPKGNYLKSDRNRYNVRNVAYSLIPPREPGFLDDLEKPSFEGDAARSLLSKQRWRDSDKDGFLEKNGQKLSFELLYPEEDLYLENISRIIIQDLGIRKIEIIPTPLTHDALQQRIKQNNYQIVLDHASYYRKDLTRTFYEFFAFKNDRINRNRIGIPNARRSRELTNRLKDKKILLEANTAIANYERFQKLIDDSQSSFFISYQHNHYFAINRNKISDHLSSSGFLNPMHLWKRK